MESNMHGFLTLDRAGVVLALLLGAALFLLGGLFCLLVMLLFLLLSTVVTAVGKKRKRRVGLYEGSRGWKNVAANGIVPLLVLIIYKVLFPGAPQTTFMLLYVASVAAVTSDKFASEVGVLGGEPLMLLTFKRVKAGTSGGVTGLGLFISLVGAALVSFISIAFLPGQQFPIFLAAMTTFSGFAGNLVDSVFGFFEERGIGNKYTSIILCAIAGCLVELLLLSL